MKNPTIDFVAQLVALYGEMNDTLQEVYLVALDEFSHGELHDAMLVIVLTETKGFRPTVGRIREIILGLDAIPVVDIAWQQVLEQIRVTGMSDPKQSEGLPALTRATLAGLGGLHAVRVHPRSDIAERDFRFAYQRTVEEHRRSVLLGTSTKELGR
jgi:hypothetical protein